MPRTVLLHYHLFKNAGTSLDQVLKRNFGDKWVTREFERRRPLHVHRQDLTQWIKDNPDAVAFSSHTIEAPPPVLPGQNKVVPLIFLRHPIDRIASAYSFERKQVNDGFGAVLARNTTLAGYIQVRLTLGFDNQCRNFHAERFSTMTVDPELAGRSTQERAMAVLRSLPFVGIVEDFDRSMDRLAALIQPDFPKFKPLTAAANVSRDHGKSLADKLAAIRAEIGDALYQQLEELNAADLALYQAGLDRVAAEEAQRAQQAVAVPAAAPSVPPTAVPSSDAPLPPSA